MGVIAEPRTVFKTLANIPRNIGNGYGLWSSGKVAMANGEFLFYGGVSIEFESTREAISNISIRLSEVPCDADGNILMKSCWLSKQQNTAWPSPDRLISFFLCTKQPTHRINLQTGVITDNTTDNNYLTQIYFSYSIGVWSSS